MIFLADCKSQRFIIKSVFSTALQTKNTFKTSKASLRAEGERQKSLIFAAGDKHTYPRRADLIVKRSNAVLQLAKMIFNYRFATVCKAFFPNHQGFHFPVPSPPV